MVEMEFLEQSQITGIDVMIVILKVHVGMLYVPKEYVVGFLNK